MRRAQQIQCSDNVGVGKFYRIVQGSVNMWLGREVYYTIYFVFFEQFKQKFNVKNIGNPDEITIREFAEEIVSLTGTKQKIIYQPLPKDDPKQRQPNITKARQLLGWEPKISRSEGLKITYEYFKSLPREVLYQREHKNFENYIRW